MTFSILRKLCFYFFEALLTMKKYFLRSAFLIGTGFMTALFSLAQDGGVEIRTGSKSNEVVLAVKNGARACGMWVRFGDGRVERKRLDAGENWSLSHTYGADGNFNIQVEGVFVPRGLRSVEACSFGNEALLTIASGIGSLKSPGQAKAEAPVVSQPLDAAPASTLSAAAVQAAQASQPTQVSEFYRDGIRLYREQKYELAYESFSGAASGGEVRAKVYMAEMLFRGRGVSQDMRAAYKLYLDAAEANLAFAQNMVGMFHRDGNVVPKSTEQARQWFQKAANGGDANAKENLLKLEKTLAAGASTPPAAGRAAQVVPPQSQQLDFYGNPVDNEGAIWVRKGYVVIGRNSVAGKELTERYKDFADQVYQRAVQLANAETAKNTGNAGMVRLHLAEAKNFEAGIITRAKEFEKLWDAQPLEYRKKFAAREGRWATIIYRNDFYGCWITVNNEGQLGSFIAQDSPNPGKEIYITKHGK